MALVVGLDIGSRSLTGVVFAGTSKSFRLVDFFREDIPSLDGDAANEGEEYEPPPSLEEFIGKTLAERNLQAIDIVAAVDAKDCIIREIPVSFTRDDQIAKVIPFEAETYLPTLDIEDIVLEHLKVGEAGGKSQVILIGAHNTVIESRLEVLKRAEADPVALDLDAAALFNAFALTPSYDSSKGTLLIDMGALSTKIVLVEDGYLKKVRAFRTAAAFLSPDRMLAQPGGAGDSAGAGTKEAGAAPGDHSIEARFQEIEEALRRLDPASDQDTSAEVELDPSTPIAILSDEDFERVQEMAASGEAVDATEGKDDQSGAKEGAGAGSEGEEGREANASEAQAKTRSNALDYRDYLDRIGTEVQRTLASSRPSVELICLTGGMSGREEARHYFSEELGVETIQLDFGDSFPSDVGKERMEEVSQYGAMAVGLAVKELGQDQTELDFRKGRFRYEHRFSRLKFPLMVAAALFFIFLLQTAFWSYHEYQQLTSRATHFEGGMGNIYETFFTKKVAAGRNPLDAAKGQSRRWTGKGIGNVEKVVPFGTVVRNFGNVLKDSRRDYDIRNMKFDFRVKTTASRGGKPAVLRPAAKSSATLMTPDKDTWRVLEKKFEPDKTSPYFSATATPTPPGRGKTEFKVDLQLTLKQSALKKL